MIFDKDRCVQTAQHLHDVIDEMLKTCVEPIAKVSSIYYDINGAMLGDYVDDDAQEAEIRDKISKEYGINFISLGKNPTLGAIGIAIILQKCGQ